jgi:ribosomal protein S10
MFTVTRAPNFHKTSGDIFLVPTYKRLIDMVQPKANRVDGLMKPQLACGFIV